MVQFKVTAMRIVDEMQSNGATRLAEYSVLFEGVEIRNCSVYKRADNNKAMFGGPPPAIMGKGHCVAIDDRKLRHAIAVEAARMYQQLGGTIKLAHEFPERGPLPKGMSVITNRQDLEARIAKAKPFQEQAEEPWVPAWLLKQDATAKTDDEKSAEPTTAEGPTLGDMVEQAMIAQRGRQD